MERELEDFELRRGCFDGCAKLRWSTRLWSVFVGD